MPARSRTYSEILASDLESLSGIHESPQKRSKLYHVPSSPSHPLKRRKTDGLNSRFDRMIETVNTIHSDKPSVRPRRNRAASSASGSSSATSYDVPKTPMDAYSGLDEGRLGQDFSVLKMDPSLKTAYCPEPYPDSEQDNCDLSEYPISRHLSKITPPRAVPQWLCNTISTLEFGHPLRDLIPASKCTSSSETRHYQTPRYLAQPMAQQSLQEIAHEDTVFAFRPPTTSDSSHLIRSANYDEQKAHSLDIERIYATKLSSSTHSPDIADPHLRHTDVSGLSVTSSASQPVFTSPTHRDPRAPSSFLPFTTPGPASNLSKIPPDVQSQSQIVSPPFLFLDLMEPAEDTPFSKPGPLAHAASSIATDSLYTTPLHGRQRTAHAKNQVHLKPTYALPFPNDLDEQADIYTLSDILRSSSSTPEPGEEDYIDTTRSVELETFNCERPPRTPITNPFSVPGPAHSSHPPSYLPRASPLRIYFDSPAEDPTDSDPLEEPDYELDLDYENFGFKWEKFDRSEGKPNMNINGSHQYLDYAEGSVPQEEMNCWENQHSSIPHTAEFECVPPQSSFRPQHPSDEEVQLAVDVDRSRDVPIPDDDDLYAQEEQLSWSIPSPQQVRAINSELASGVHEDLEHVAGSSQEKLPVVFAPAPGIFVSPLRGEDDDTPEADNEDMVAGGQDQCERQVTPDAAKQNPSWSDIMSLKQPKAPPPQPKSTTPRTPDSKARRTRTHKPDRDGGDSDESEDDSPSKSQRSNDSIESWGL